MYRSTRTRSETEVEVEVEVEVEGVVVWIEVGDVVRWGAS